MAIRDMLLPELGQEAAHTRRLLERVPTDSLDWQPHPKSMTLCRLASHVAEIPQWAVNTIRHDSLDIAPPGSPPYVPTLLSSADEMVRTFDVNVAAARDALGEASDALLGESWSLLHGGRPIFTLPRVVVLRTMVFNHLIHHRAQLGVFLRLLDLPLPAIYGPSADEAGM